MVRECSMTIRISALRSCALKWSDHIAPTWQIRHDRTSCNAAATCATASGKTMRFFQHVLSLRERTRQLDAPTWQIDSMFVFPRVYAAIDGHLATARGPWSDGSFVSPVLHPLASEPELAA